MRRRFQAFTLIELLVVIAIISILAGILFPVFAKAKAAAKKTACISNLKQIGSSLALYVSDYDGVFPNAIDPSDRFTPQIWQDFPEYKSRIDSMPLINEALQPYLKSKEVFHCPADTGSRMLDSHPDQEFVTSPSMFKTYGSSYFFRTEIAFKFMTDSSFKLPAQVNVMFDGAGHWHGDGRALEKDDMQNGTNLLAVLHAMRYNVLFGDYHVKSLTRDPYMAAWDTEL